MSGESGYLVLTTAETKDMIGRHLGQAADVSSESEFEDPAATQADLEAHFGGP